MRELYKNLKFYFVELVLEIERIEQLCAIIF
jgi:hypothetical protein